jgi:hypothetical protein
LREGGCACGHGASSCSSTRSCSPLSGQWSKPADIGRSFDTECPGIKWCAQCDVSQRCDTPMNKRLRLRHPAPLPARNQSEIYSMCSQQESQVNKVLLLCRSMLDACCAPAVCRTCSLRCCYLLQHACCAPTVYRTYLLRSCGISQHACGALTAPRPSLPLPLTAKWQMQRQRQSDRKEALEAWG